MDMNSTNKRILFILPYDINNGALTSVFNSGNNVFLTAGVSYFYSSSINIQFVEKNILIKKLCQDDLWVYKNFDIVLTMEANIFSERFKNELENEANLIKQLKRPIYVLGAGAQSDVNYSDSFMNNISDAAKKYLDSILNSGGTITLRGNFTRNVLSDIGYSDLFVSGCPSLFFKPINISNTKCKLESFIPMFNGRFFNSINTNFYSIYTRSCFFDQDQYLKLLYFPNEIKNFNEEKFESPFRELYIKKRILGAINYYNWQNQIKKGGFNFSYGSRIHGNIIALQNNIPAFLKVENSRTREIAEFFNIPNSISIHFDEKKDDLYELYCNLNYDLMNTTIKSRLDDFKTFLEQNNIPNVFGNNTEFWEDKNNKFYKKDVIVPKYSLEIYKKLPNKYMKIVNRFFSIRNEYSNNIQRKVITILGIKIKIKHKKLP